MEQLVSEDLFGEPFVAGGQWVAGVSVEVRGQWRGDQVGNALFLQVGGDAVFDLFVGFEAFGGKHRFVERADKHDDIVATGSQEVQGLSELSPLEGGLEGDPFEGVFSQTSLSPGDLLVAEVVGGLRHGCVQRGEGVLIGMLVEPGGEVLCCVAGELYVLEPVKEVPISGEGDSDAFGEIGMIAWDVHCELGREVGVIELEAFLGLEVVSR